MSELSTLKSTVYGDITTAVDSYVSSPNAHVIREDDGEPDSPPMVALNGQDRQRSSQNRTTGLHEVRVLDVLSSPFDVKYGRERTFSVDVTITDIDGDRADNILEDIETAFEYNPRFRPAETFVSSVKIDEIRVEDTSPTSRDQRLGHALNIEIDYVRSFLYSDVSNPPAEVKKVVQQYESGTTVTTTDSGTTVDE